MSFFKNKLGRGPSLRVSGDDGAKRSKLSALFSRSARRRDGGSSPISATGMKEAAATLGRNRAPAYEHLDAGPEEWAPVPPGFVEQDFSYYARDFDHYESERREREARRARDLQRSATLRARPSPKQAEVARSHSTSARAPRALGSNNPFNTGTQGHGARARRQPPPPQPIWVQFEPYEPRSSSSSSSRSS